MHKTLVVINQNNALSETDIKTINFSQYLNDFPKKGEQPTRLINLCNVSQYLSEGYYCSLLAEARCHKVLPSVSTINDLTASPNGVELVLPEGIAKQLDEIPKQDILSIFGWHQHKGLNKAAGHAFELFPAPILKLTFSGNESKVYLTVQLWELSLLNAQQIQEFEQRLAFFTSQIWRNKKRDKSMRWEMAILVDENESLPPSDKGALKKFVKAAKHFGIHAELVNAKQIGLLSRFDALFIRETTAIRHHTYQLARAAENEGLAVIDDADSILRCCNKVFLHDAFSYNQIPAPRTRFVADFQTDTLDSLEDEFAYPMVLKLPESSFSKGVFKVSNREECERRLKDILTESAIVLVQEYIYTAHDWRIGVLNGRAIYACRYHMARNHWQIYNHDAKRFSSGDFDTLATFEAPRKVLEAAVKACAFIGNSLYGVDIKYDNDTVYVIEVNDNPNIDMGIEDKYLGDELYMQIMQEFSVRLEQRGKH